MVVLGGGEGGEGGGFVDRHVKVEVEVDAFVWP
jgi:hypothetical protein